MKLIFEIAISIILLLVTAFAGTYLVWLLTGRKKSYSQLLSRYGELIGYITLIAGVVLYFYLEPRL